MSSIDTAVISPAAISPASAQPSGLPSMRTAAVALALIVAIYIVSTVKSFTNSPAGKAMGSILGSAASILTALANLPTWLLVGLGLSYLLGPSILKLSGSYVRKLAGAAKEYNSKAAAKKADGATDDEIDAYAAGAVSQSNQLIREQVLRDNNGGSASDQERAAQAKQASDTVRETAAESGHAASDAEGREDADKFMDDY